MKITKIEVQKNNPNRFSIYLNGEFAFGITDELKYKYKLKKGNKLSKKTLNSILADEKLNKAVNYTLHLLSYRARSEKEIRDKLIEKEYMDHQIEYAINYCLERGYINDLDFADTFVRDKIRINKHGPSRIKYDLRRKGISDDIINQALDNNYDPDIEYETALKLAKKQIKKYKNDDKYKKYRKLGGYLGRRGYSYDIINKILNELIN